MKLTGRPIDLELVNTMWRSVQNSTTEWRSGDAMRCPT